MNRIVFGCIFALLATAGSAAAAPADGLIDKVVAAYGGAAALKSMNGLKETGTTLSLRRGVTGSLERFYLHPDRLRVDIHYPGESTESRIVTPTRAWRNGVPSRGPMRLAMVLQATRLGLPRLLLEQRDRVLDRGTLQDPTGERRVLELPLAKGVSVIAEIDPQSGRILRSRGLMNAGRGTMEFATAYEDFRMQDGELFAFREQHYAMGRHLGHTQLQRVERVKDLPETLFRPDDPKSGPQAGQQINFRSPARPAPVAP